MVDPRLKFDDFGDCGESPTIVLELLEAVHGSDEGIESSMSGAGSVSESVSESLSIKFLRSIKVS